MARIAWKGGRLTNKALIKGWKRFKYDSTTGGVLITSGKYDLLIGVDKPETPVRFLKYVPSKQ